MIVQTMGCVFCLKGQMKSSPAQQGSVGASLLSIENIEKLPVLK
jgi:hypothetical protein